MRLTRYIIAARPTGRRCWNTAHYTSSRSAKLHAANWRLYRTREGGPVYAAVMGPYKAVFHV